MIKKLLVAAMATTAAVCGAFGFAACGESHTHDYGADWKSDKDYHWHECQTDGCDEKVKDKEAHADTDSDGKCDVCKYVITVIHRHELTPVDEKAATCTTDGNSAYYTCGGCEKWFYDGDGLNEITDKNSVILKKGHKLTTIEEKSATCTADGNTAYYTCSVCEKWFSDNDGNAEITDKSSVVISKKDHKLTLVDKKDPNCTTEGNSAYYTCGSCGKWFTDENGKTEITDKSSVIIPIKHELVSVARKEATCTKDGNIAYYTCGKCDKLFADEAGKNEISTPADVIIGKSGHDFKGTACSVCGVHKPTDGIEYTEKYNYCEVAGIGTATDTDIYIADLYNGKPVTRIKASAFKDCATITSVTVPDGVEFIGSSAFENCGLLESAVIADTVTTLGGFAFENCASLTNIKLSGGLTMIDGRMFKGCGKLNNVVIPNTVTSIASNVFTDCVSLTNITLSAGLTSLGNETFKGCTKLTEITLPSTLTSIKASVFADSGINTITFKGTEEQWNAIQKSFIWDGDMGAYTVRFTNGEI